MDVNRKSVPTGAFAYAGGDFITVIISVDSLVIDQPQMPEELWFMGIAAFDVVISLREPGGTWVAAGKFADYLKVTNATFSDEIGWSPKISVRC